MITAAAFARARRRGITLTEILIAILILGVGLVSLATLFPIGLLRLRDAARYSRSSFLAQSASADLSSRSLLSSSSFINTLYYNGPQSGLFSPLVQDTAYPGVDWAGAVTTGTAASPGAYAGSGGLGTPGAISVATASGSTNYGPLNGPGLPIAYDPLWRYQTINTNGTQGYYPKPDTTYQFSPYEARFGSGIGFIRTDADGNPPSAHGLQRITNFNVATGIAFNCPSIFVSPEDVVLQEPSNQSYVIAGNVISEAAATATTPLVGTAPSPVIPDLSISRDTANNPNYQPTNDYHYSWLFTGQLVNSSNQACFDGNIVILENRQFGISVPAIPNPPDATTNLQAYQVDGETVVEAIFGYSGNVQTETAGGVTDAAGYGAGADRTVLLRWISSVPAIPGAAQPDPVVKAGDWIADVTYERNQSYVQSRWWQSMYTPNAPFGYRNKFNNDEWDNLPAQRCYWYQVQKVLPAGPDPFLTTHRSMIVYVNQSLVCRTALTVSGTPPVVTPAAINAALIMPSVVNVIPTTIFTR